MENIFDVGDVMCDALLFYKRQAEKLTSGAFFLSRVKLLFGVETQKTKQWYRATIYRAENADSAEKMEEILKAFEELDLPVGFPVHPRSAALVSKLKETNGYSNTIFLEPRYIAMGFLMMNAKKVITDSGGMQKEAYLLDVP
ncbi:MAG: UDP-N-acetylglucosamine 2-epimerase [Oscillospiraceae bacterium]